MDQEIYAQRLRKERANMKAMLVAFVAVAAISVGSNLILMQIGFSSQDRAAGPDVRLDD
jgi:hypothetical protein